MASLTSVTVGILDLTRSAEEPDRYTETFYLLLFVAGITFTITCFLMVWEYLESMVLTSITLGFLM